MKKFLSLLLMSVLAVSAAWAADVTDVLNNAATGVSGTNYASWTHTGTSGTVYAGQSAGGNSSIQLRSNNSNSGIVSTSTAGKLKSVKITFNSNTADARTVDVYGNNTAYTAPTDLYGSNAGTKIGSVTMSNGATQTITVTGDYTYVGLRSASGALYLDEVQITWSGESGDTPQPTTYSLTLPTGLTGGSVSSNVSNAASIAAGTSITVTATPDQGYVLDWMKANDTEVSNPYTFNIAQNTVITAVFKEEGSTPNVLVDVTFKAGTDVGTETGTGTYEDVITKSGVTLTGHDTPLGNSDNYRVYKGKSVELSVDAGDITKIVFNCTASGTTKYGPGCFAAQNGYTYSGSVGTWTGKAKNVSFTAESNQVRATSIVVTVELPADGELIAPVISGTTPFIGSTEVTITNPNENGSIYYTIDGGDPTAEDALYNGPFTIAETTTVKAVVVDGDDVSDVASKEFVRRTEVNDVPSFYNLDDNTEFVYSGSLMAIAQNGAYLYAQATDAADTDKGVLIYQYDLGQSYELGNVIAGGFEAKKTNYNGTIEMTNISGIQASTSSVEATPLELTPLQVTTQNVNRYVVVKGATLTAESNNNSSATVDGESVDLYTKTLGVSVPDEITNKTFDVYAVAAVHNGKPQLLPIRFEPNDITPQPSEFPAPTFSFQENTLVENGDAVIVLPENATSLNYWYGTDSQNAIDNVVDQTATSDVTLDLSQFTLRDYVYVNAQAIYADGESDIVSTALYVGDPDYEFPLVFVAEPTEGGTITGQATALGNEVVEFTVTPAEGYTLKKVEAKYTEFGNAYGGNDIVIDGNTFTMPAYSKIDVKNENRVFITATFEEDAPSSGTYDVTFVAGTDLGTETGQGTYADVITKSGVTLTGHDTPLGNTDNYRVYQGKSIELSVATGKITNIVLTSTANKGSKYGPDLISASEGTYSTEDGSKVGTWTGATTSVTFTASAQARFTSIDVTVELPAEGELIAPVISGTTPFIGSTEITITNPNENGSIYYTIDGGDPTAEDALYSEPFTITETTTVKAVVVDGNDVSDVASKEFVRKAEVDNVPAFYELANNAEFVYSGSLMAIAQNGAYLYAQATDAADDEKGVLIYQSNLGQSYELGNVIPGGFGAKKTLYNGTVEMTNISGIQASTSSIEATPLELKPLQVTADIENRYVVVKGATLSAESSNYESSATVNGEAVEIYTKTLGVRIPDDFTGKTFDVYAVATMHNGISQLLPINFIETFTATVDPEIENGEVTILNEGTTFHEGDIIEFKVEPAQGYAIDDVRVEGVNTDQVIIPELADNIYTFQMPTDDVVIRVTFSEISTFTVTTEVTGEGSIQILNDGTAFHADDLIEFSVNPGEGYELDNLSVFCENINLAIEPNLEDDIYSFNMPVDNVIISASFRESVAPLWLIGNVNDVGWHTNNGAKMDYDAENEVYTLDITVENASEGFGWFGIVTALTENDNDWDNLNENRLSAGENNANDFAVNYRNHNNIALVPFSQAPHSFQLLAGDYTVIIDKDMNYMQIFGEFNTPNYYLIGSYNGWANDDSKVQLEYNDETGKFEATQSMVANAEFKLIDDQGLWYGGDSNGNFIVTQEQVEKGTELTILAGGGNNLQIPVAGNWTFSFDDTNMKLVISGIWKNPTTLAEILATAEADDDVIVANDLAIVDIVADQHIAFATDGEGNWIELSMDSDVLDFVEATPTLAGGSVKGMFIYDGFNPTIVIEEMPEAAENDLTIEPAVYPVNLDFAPKPCEIFYVTGYYHRTGGSDNMPNLREWSGNGGQMGVLLDLDLSWARGSMEDGKHYKIRGTALLKEAWEAPSADGIRPRMATDDPMALRNYTIMATDIPDTPTAIETLVKNVEAKRVRYYNLQGIELNAPANGLNIIVIEHNDGSITTHKVLN